MELPLFPLHVVLFPGRPLPLHVFEPRYRQLLRDVLAGDRRFGVVAIRRGGEVGPGADVHTVGTVAEVEEVEPLADGRSEIVTRGQQRFRLTGPLQAWPYPHGEVELLTDPEPGPRAGELAVAVREALTPYLCGLGAPRQLMAHLPTDPVRLGYLAAASLQTELPEQQRLLELDRPEERLAATLRLLRREEGIARHFGAVGSLRPPGPGGSELN